MMRQAVAFVAVALGVLFGGPTASVRADDERALVVGMTGKYPPFSYFADGVLAGFDAEVAYAVCERMGRRCELRALDWDALLGALLTGRVDLVVSSVAITAERSRSVAFSVPYYDSGPRLFAAPNAPPSDSRALRIGVTLGTTYDALARRTFPNATIRVYRGDVEALADVRAGRLDAILTDEIVGEYLAHLGAVEVAARGPRLASESMGVALRPSDDALRQSVDDALRALREDGSLSRMLEARVTAPSTADAHTTAAGMVALLLTGLASTLRICAQGLFGGMALAVVAAWLLVRRSPLRVLTVACVDFVRATPFLVQLFALYFGPPSLGIPVSGRTSASVAIALHSAAYLAEVIKVAYLSVPDGQRLAARSLGFSPAQSLRYVVAPQMMPVATVPVLNTLVAMIKDSAVVSVIGVYELTLQTQRLVATTFRPVELYLAAGALYFLLTWPLILLGRRLERRYRMQGLTHGA